MIGFTDIVEASARIGLVVRGGFHPSISDGVPLLPAGATVATVILLGNVGASLWPAFSLSPEFCDGGAHALDRWTRRIASGLAAQLGAAALYPFGGPPHWPFQRWAQRAEAVHSSPLGLLIHPDHGLWHAYRAALLFADVIALPPRDERASPCTTCADKPCLSACPVGAFSGTGYDVNACATHIASAAGSECMKLGCRARRACPVAPEKAYIPAVARFHMDAFLAARPSPISPSPPAQAGTIQAD